MKTTLREKFTLESLNLKSDSGLFSHRMLRSKLIAEKYYNPKFHTKGKMYLEVDGKEVILMCAYEPNKGQFCYVPMLSIEFKAKPTKSGTMSRLILNNK